jgi:hypothetical protein
VDADLAVAAVLEVELDLGDGPRGFNAEDSLVEVLVSHAQGERAPRQGPSRAASKPPLFLSERRCSPRRYSIARPRPKPRVKAGGAAEHSEGSLEARLSGVGMLSERRGTPQAPRRHPHKSGKTQEQLATQVATSPAQRLANFQYAAPEQRTPGLRVATPADIYALGLILNEMFTRAVPHGTDYQQIADVASDFGFLDELVRQMLKQNPEERPRSIGEVKGLIQRHQAEAVTLQRLSTSTETVIPMGQVDEPLAYEPPRLVSIDWANRYLTLLLDRPVTQQWVAALGRMNGFSYLAGKRPESFRFEKNKAHIEARENEVQIIVNHFKEWLLQATATLRSILEEAAADADRERRELLRREREAGEQRLRVLRQTKI